MEAPARMAQEIVPWVIGANALLSIAALLHSWFSASGKRLQKRIDQIAASVDALEEDWDAKAEKRSAEFRAEVRDLFAEIKEAVAITSSRNTLTERSIAVLESRLDQMPSRDMTHRLEISLARVEGRLETLDERIRPVAAVATRLQEHAMEESRK